MSTALSSPMGKRRKQALLCSFLAALVSATESDTCDAAGSCAGADDVSILQLPSSSRAGGVLSPESIKEHVAVEDLRGSGWRDALEVEQDFFESLDHAKDKSAALLEVKGRLVKPWHVHCSLGQCDPNKHPHHRHDHRRKSVYAANVQAPPQKPPYGPFAYSDDGTYTRYEPPSEYLKRIPEVRSSNGLLETTLVVDAGWFEVPGTGIRVHSRLFNNSSPAPTIRVRRGDWVNITVINRLGTQASDRVKQARREGQATSEFPHGIPADNPRYQDVGQSSRNPIHMHGMTNNMHQPNTTNLHVHGWHVSQVYGQDNVLDVTIEPGQSFKYGYQLSPYHGGGNSWYHPHWHGSVTLQVFGGMVGALVVEDTVNELPSWIENMREEVLVIQEVNLGYYGPLWLEFLPNDPYQGCFPFGSDFSTECALGHRTALFANLSGDLLWRLEYADGWGFQQGQKVPIDAFFSVNGQYRPTIPMVTGEWVRLRLILSSGNFPINLIVEPALTNVSASDCEMYLIAKDSAYVQKLPRLITKGVFMGAGNRCQVLVRCSKPGSWIFRNNVTSYAFSNVDPQQTFMYFNVTGTETTFDGPPAQFATQYPRYLNDLVSLPMEQVFDPLVPPATNQYNGKPVDTPIPMLQNKTVAQVFTYDFPGGSPGLVPILPTAYQNQPVRFGINNMTFSPTKPMATFPVGKVIQLSLGNLNTHSWHMHTHPVQMLDFGGTTDYLTLYGNFFNVGDWHDVVIVPDVGYDVRAEGTNATVRFQVDCYTGPLVVHCHVLYHEDLGMMTWFNSTGDDHTINPMFSNQGPFQNPPVQCTQPGQQCAPPYCTDYVYGSP